jgi:hypothetical protein
MTTDQKWQPCQPGTIQNIVQQQKQNERRETMTRRAVFSTFLFACAGVTYSLLKHTASQQTPLTCGQTMALARQYVLDKLNPQQVSQVDVHLAKCPKCKDLIARVSESIQA